MNWQQIDAAGRNRVLLIGSRKSSQHFVCKEESIMNAWERNQNWRELPEPDVGDIVQLKLVDVFDYLVDATVVALNDNKVTAVIKALCDYKTRVTLTGGKKLRLIGKQISLGQEFIQNTIKKPASVHGERKINGWHAKRNAA
jgi:hypothetical protein